MIAVLHTFGSDMKYHVHVHCLITFGGLTPQGLWLYPKHKYKIARYRELSAKYRSLFLNELKVLFDKKKIQYHQAYETLIKDLENKRWVVHNTRPTIDTKVLENYLARYINRVAISNSRIQYLQKQQQVQIIYNDYSQQKAGSPAPKALKILNPLTAIDQIMQHVLPPYFQKSRRYGIHSAAVKKRLASVIPNALKRNGQTIRTLFEILTQLLKIKPFSCEKCQATEYYIENIKPNKKWVNLFLSIPFGRSPPYPSYISTIPTMKQL